MLEAIELACVRGERLLFRDLSFCVNPGTLLWVSGGNGAGKTSLLRLLCGLARAESGKVCWNGLDINKEREDFQRALIFQGHSNALKDDLTPAENLRFASQGTSDAATISHSLREQGLEACLALPVRVLSQGQKRRVALTRLSLAGGRKLWILDEPFTALDAPAIGALANLVASHVRQGGMVVLTSHQDVMLGEIPLRRLHLPAERTTQ